LSCQTILYELWVSLLQKGAGNEVLIGVDIAADCSSVLRETGNGDIEPVPLLPASDTRHYSRFRSGQFLPCGPEEQEAGTGYAREIMKQVRNENPGVNLGGITTAEMIKRLTWIVHTWQRTAVSTARGWGVKPKPGK